MGKILDEYCKKIKEGKYILFSLLRIEDYIAELENICFELEGEKDANPDIEYIAKIITDDKNTITLTGTKKMFEKLDELKN